MRLGLHGSLRDAAVDAGPPASLWRHADFMWLWAAQTISLFGSQVTQLAIPLIAVTTLNAAPAQMGILSAVSTAPFLLIGLLAGAWVDRWRRRPVLIAGDIGRALVLVALPVAMHRDVLSLPVLYAGALAIGVLTVFFDVAWQAYLPSLVGRRRLLEGNSKLEASRSTAQIAGPGFAGAVIQALTAPTAVLVNAASFALSAVCIWFIRKPEPAPQAAPVSLLDDVREGLAVVFGNPVLRGIAGCTGTSNFFSAALWAVLILFATRELKLPPVAIGLVFTAGNIGALVGVLLAGPAARRIGLGPVLVAAPLLSSLGLWPVALATPAVAVPMLIAGQALMTIGGPIYNINQVSLRQAITPLRLQGRMNATMRFLVWGTMPIGGLLGGALGQAFGLRTAIVVIAIGGMTAFLWVWRSPVRTLVRFPEPVE
ncbi:MAG: MFS transporter [Armatimonadota bacterium]|nr:MFS transporter [Armatimonadota bacterium]